MAALAVLGYLASLTPPVVFWVLAVSGGYRDNCLHQEVAGTLGLVSVTILIGGCSGFCVSLWNSYVRARWPRVHWELFTSKSGIGDLNRNWLLLLIFIVMAPILYVIAVSGRFSNVLFAMALGICGVWFVVESVAFAVRVLKPGPAPTAAEVRERKWRGGAREKQARVWMPIGLVFGVAIALGTGNVMGHIGFVLMFSAMTAGFYCRKLRWPKDQS